MNVRAVVLTAALLGLTACSIPLRTARVDAMAEPSDAEVDAALRVARCRSVGWSLVAGARELCRDEPELGGFLLGSEAAVGALGFSQPGGFNTATLATLQDAYVTSWTAPAIDHALARHRLYAPVDSGRELVAAPWNKAVLARPGFWAVTGGGLVLGVAVSALAPDEAASLVRPVGLWHPVLYGREYPGGIGAPLLAASDAVVAENVAVSEELLFRGILQSGLARATHSEWAGWGMGTLLFGSAHIANAFATDAEGRFVMSRAERLSYLTVSVPTITVVGGGMGLLYKEEGYTLGPSVAAHFWYDALLLGVDAFVDPTGSPFAITTSGTW